MSIAPCVGSTTLFLVTSEVTRDDEDEQFAYLYNANDRKMVGEQIKIKNAIQHSMFAELRGNTVFFLILSDIDHDAVEDNCCVGIIDFFTGVTRKKYFRQTGSRFAQLPGTRTFVFSSYSRELRANKLCAVTFAEPAGHSTNNSSFSGPENQWNVDISRSNLNLRFSSLMQFVGVPTAESIRQPLIILDQDASGQRFFCTLNISFNQDGTLSAQPVRENIVNVPLLDPPEFTTEMAVACDINTILVVNLNSSGDTFTVMLFRREPDQHGTIQWRTRRAVQIPHKDPARWSEFNLVSPSSMESYLVYGKHESARAYILPIVIFPERMPEIGKYISIKTTLYTPPQDLWPVTPTYIEWEGQITQVLERTRDGKINIHESLPKNVHAIVRQQPYRGLPRGSRR